MIELCHLSFKKFETNDQSSDLEGFKVLHEKALQITRSYLKAESDLISVLQEIDDCRGYREMGYNSLFEYATQGLELSESVSFNFITMRLVSSLSVYPSNCPYSDLVDLNGAPTTVI